MAAGPPSSPLPPGGLSPGDQVLVLVFYDDPSETGWHARILLALIDADHWTTLTPDGDIYAEQISSASPDLLAWRPLDRNGDLPCGIQAGHVYAFRNQRHAAQTASSWFGGS